MTEKLLLQEFATSSSASAWSGLWRPIFAGVLMGALILAVISPFLIQGQGPKTLADRQKFESLSEAEALLGTLPANAKTEDGIKIADIRERLHSINELRQEVDLSLNENGEPGTFPHTQLRDNALEVIEQEERLVAMVDISVDIRTFSDKVAGWPITNENVDFETHKKAVTGYLNHASAWDEATEAWAEDLVD